MFSSFSLQEGSSLPLRKITLILLVCSIITTLPAWIFPLIQSGDGYAHELFLRFFSDAFYEGHWYPRWLHGMYATCGDATMYFYPPLTYFLGLLTLPLTGDPRTAFILLLIPMTLLGSLAMYRYLREFFAPNTSLIGSVLFIFFPFHLTSYYVSGSSSEYFSYTTVPFILLAIRRLFRQEYAYTIMLAAAAACMFLTSVSMVLVLVMFLPCYVLYEALSARPPKHAWWRITLSFVASGIIAALLSAALLIPYLTEISHVKVGNHFAYPDTLGELKKALATPSMALTYYITFAFMGYLIVGMWKHSAARTAHHRLFRYLLLTTCYALFLMLPFSLYLWYHIPLLTALQTPVRIGFFLVFLWAPIVCLYAQQLGNASHKNLKSILVICMFLPLVTTVRGEYGPVQVVMSDYAVRATNEYLPQQVEMQRWRTTNSVREAGVTCRIQAELLTGNAAVEINEWKAYTQTLTINATESSVLRLGRFSYPYWQITQGTATLQNDEPTGQILLEVPAGEQVIRIDYVEPDVIGLVNRISLLSWVIMLLALWRWRKAWKPAAAG